MEIMPPFFKSMPPDTSSDECFKKMDKQKALPTPILFARIAGLIDTELSEATANVDRVLPIGLRKLDNQRAKTRITEIGAFLRGRFGITATNLESGALRTFGDLAGALHKAQEALRKTRGKPGGQLALDEKVISDLSGRLDRVRFSLASGIQTALNTSGDGPGQKELDFRPLLSTAITAVVAHQNSLKGIGGLPIISQGESVKKDSVVLLRTFLDLVRESAKEACRKQQDFAGVLEENIGISVDQETNKETYDLFIEWAHLINTPARPVPGKTQVQIYPWLEGEEADKPLPVEQLLMPKKCECLGKRGTDPNGEPEWNLTDSEELVLRHKWSTELKERSRPGTQPGDLSEDAEFCNRTAQEINGQLSGGMPLLRGQIEVRNRIRRFEAKPVSPDPTSPDSSDPSSDPPPPGSSDPPSDKPSNAPSLPIKPPRPPHSIENPPAVYYCDRALAATRELAGIDAGRHGDQLMRRLLQKLHEHLSSRREELWSNPESTTSFDEFAIRFLLVVSGIETKQLFSKVNEHFKDTADIPTNIKAARIIAENLRERLVPDLEQAAVLPQNDARILLARIHGLPKPFGSYAEATAKRFTVETNKVSLSQALLLEMHSVLSAASKTLLENRLPEGVTIEYLDTAFEFIEAFIETYDISDTDELAIASNENRESGSSHFFKTIQTSLQSESAVCRLPIHGLTNAETLRTELLAEQTELQGQLQAIEAEMEQAVVSVLNRICALEKQMTPIAEAAGDGDLDQLLERIQQSKNATRQLLPADSTWSEPDTASTVKLFDIPKEVATLETEAGKIRDLLKGLKAKQERCSMALQAIPKELAVVARIAAAQNETHTAFEDLEKMREGRGIKS